MFGPHHKRQLAMLTNRNLVDHLPFTVSAATLLIVASVRDHARFLHTYGAGWWLRTLRQASELDWDAPLSTNIVTEHSVMPNILFCA